MDYAVTRTGKTTTVRRPDRWTITHTAGEHFATVFDAAGALVDAVQVVVTLAVAARVDAVPVIDTVASAVGVAFGGSRVGAAPMGEAERGDAAPRIWVSYWCSRGHESKPSFAADAVVPEEWDCPRCGLPSGPDQANPPSPQKVEPYKTHLAYVKERRSDSAVHGAAGGARIAPIPRPVTVKTDDLSDVKVEDLSDALAKYASGDYRIWISYWCSKGHVSKPDFASDAVIPEEWDCPRCGLPSWRD